MNLGNYRWWVRTGITLIVLGFMLTMCGGGGSGDWSDGSDFFDSSS